MAVLVYRFLLFVRGCWMVAEWFFGWGAQGHNNSFTLLHPYASLFAHATVVALLLIVLTGLWFFRRWARLIFVLVLALAVINGVARPHNWPSPTLTFLAIMLSGAIVAMSFLPPVRYMFANQDLTNR
jgi:hypothetical protein